MIAENLVLKQQLIVLRRGRRRSPNLTLSDRIVSQTFGIDIDKNVVYRVLAKHHRPAPRGTGPSWLSFIGHTTNLRGWAPDEAADLNHLRWVSHCRGLVQLPVAA